MLKSQACRRIQQRQQPLFVLLSEIGFPPQTPVFIVMYIAIHIMIQAQGTIPFFVQLKHLVNPNKSFMDTGTSG